MKTITRLAMAGVSLGALAAPFQVSAQGTKPAAAPAADADAKDDIVVVGTLIRGTTVVGSQTLSVDAQQITQKAALSTNELLGAIPQIANTFNGRIEGDPRGYAGAGTSITRPNLRNIPSVNTTSGGLTLLLLDGQRLTTVGVNQASGDADIVPAAVMQGVDVVTDGGSSLYGADAVAGVINFRTLRKFDGVKIDGNFGFGTTIKGWHEWDAGITAGTSWTGGNAYIYVGHSRRDLILNNQVPWSSPLVYNAAGVSTLTGTQCIAPVGTETRWYRFGPGASQFTNNTAAPGAGTFATGSPCDQLSSETYFPKQQRTNVFAALSQELGDRADLRVTGYWMKRQTELYGYPRGMTAAGSPLTTGALVGAAFPNAAVGSLTAVPGGIGFSFGANAAYVNRPQLIKIETWGINPELTYKFGSDWQARASILFGRSNNYQSFPGVDTVKGQCYITGCTGIAAGQLNPLNVSAASAAVITDITNYENAQQTKQQTFIARVVVDGPLFALPGGDAKVAVGAEYQDNRADSRLNSGPIDTVFAQNYLSAKRNAKSLFAEISLPVTTFADVSASFRYDNYSDFGSTTNPNIGITLKPTSWLKFFGHWNTSFNAPTAVDDLGIGTGRFACGIYTPNGTPRPTDPLGRDTSKQGSCALVLQGGRPGLQPQTATSWAAGFELTPVRSLQIGGQFYSIDLKNALGTLNPANTATYSTNPDLYTYNLTAAQYAVFLAQLTNGAALAAQQPASNIAIVVDTRVSNLNAAKLEGVDFHIRYDGDIGVGRLSAGIEATRATRALITNGGVAANQLAVGSPAFTAVTWVGLTSGRVTGRVTFNYSGRFNDAGLNNLGTADDIQPFTTTNLSLGYNIGDDGGALSGTSFRVTVDNLFDASPQLVKRANLNNPSYANWTFGRVIKLGISKKF